MDLESVINRLIELYVFTLRCQTGEEEPSVRPVRSRCIMQRRSSVMGGASIKPASSAVSSPPLLRLSGVMADQQKQRASSSLFHFLLFELLPFLFPVSYLSSCQFSFLSCLLHLFHSPSIYPLFLATFQSVVLLSPLLS